MKKLSYLLGLILVTGIIFSSCSKDEEEKTPPTLKFLTGTSPIYNVPLVTSDTTMEAGEKFVFGFEATSTTDKNLHTLTIKGTYENVSERTWDTTLATNTFRTEVQIITYDNPGTEVFEVTVTDRNNQSATISFSVTTFEADPGIVEYENIALGSYSSSTNSSFASVTGETFSMTDAEDPAVQQKISWIYFHGVVYGHTIMSPGNAEIQDIYDGVAEWEHKNSTLMAKTSLTIEQYELIVNKNQLILTIQNSGVSPMTENFHSELQSDPGGFEVGDIIAFETYDGHQGLIRVTEVNGNANIGESTIKYNLKIEK
jgi:hypothetical protein